MTALAKTSVVVAVLSLPLSCSSGSPSDPGIAAWLPQVAPEGQTITHPKLVPVFFDPDPLAQQLEDFLGKLVASSYWGAVAEYGVGAATVASSIHVKDAPLATIDGDGIASWLGSRLDGSHPEFTVDAETLYVLFWPASSTYVDKGAVGCVDIAGYHQNLVFKSGMEVPYGVLLRCDSAVSHTLAGELRGLDLLTNGSAHEVLEMATDPHLRAYDLIDDDFYAYKSIGGGAEIGDMCLRVPGVRPDDLGYHVPRVWSNRAARAGQDACVPGATVPYFLAVVEGGERLVVDNEGAKGFPLGAGESRILDVKLLASDTSHSADAIGVTAVEAVTLQAGNADPELTFAFDRPQGLVGETLRMTVTRKSGSSSAMRAFFLKATRGADTTYSPWLIVGR